MAQQNHPTKTQGELFCSSSEESHDDSIIDTNYENKTDSSESSEITSDSSQNSLILKKELIVKNAESSNFLDINGMFNLDDFVEPELVDLNEARIEDGGVSR
jgi:predicted nuclease of restriction endonuclease-like (RecB) superfamily